MRNRFRLLTRLLLLLLAGCRTETVVAPAPDDYFPLVLNTYRTYAVADSSWTNGRLTVSTFQFREAVRERFLDAAGLPAFRLVRSRRASAAAPWVDDSALTVQTLAKAVLLTQNNVRTVELIYPPQAGRGWNANAFTAAPDTITSRSRFYAASVGGAYTTPVAGGQPAKTYPTTVSTRATLPAKPGERAVEDLNAFCQRGLRQVYARDVGRVLRRRFRYFTFTTDASGLQTPTPGVVQNGNSRQEVLVETGVL